jgi:cytochrome c2
VRKEIAHLNLVPGKLVRYRIKGDPSADSGGKLLEAFACRRCHKIGGKGNSLAPDLDRLGARHPSRVLESILRPATYMPDFRFDPETASLLANAVVKTAAVSRHERREAPLIIRFNHPTQHNDNVFEKHCGGCHRLLTESGALGKGNSGPNLSGLMGRYYPKTYAKTEQWDQQRLAKWLKNPRASRPLSRMQPVNIDKRDFNHLLLILNASYPRYLPPNSVKSRKISSVRS